MAFYSTKSWVKLTLTLKKTKDINLTRHESILAPHFWLISWRWNTEVLNHSSCLHFKKLTISRNLGHTPWAASDSARPQKMSSGQQTLAPQSCCCGHWTWGPQMWRSGGATCADACEQAGGKWREESPFKAFSWWTGGHFLTWKVCAVRPSGTWAHCSFSEWTGQIAEGQFKEHGCFSAQWFC